MREKVVAHVALNLSCSAENTIAPADAPRQNNKGDYSHRQHCGNKAGFSDGFCFNAVDHTTHNDGYFGLGQIDQDQHRHTDEIAPLVLSDELPCIRASQDVHDASLTHLLFPHVFLLHDSLQTPDSKQSNFNT